MNTRRIVVPLNVGRFAPVNDRARGRNRFVVDPLMPQMITAEQAAQLQARQGDTEPSQTGRGSVTERRSPAAARMSGQRNPQVFSRQEGVSRSRPASGNSAAITDQRNRPTNRPSRAAEPRSGPGAATVNPGPELVSVSLTEPGPESAFTRYLNRATNPGFYCEECGEEFYPSELVKGRKRNAPSTCSDRCRKAKSRRNKRKEQAARGGPITTRERYFQRAAH